jgi:predicted nucleic acid-binding protein
MSRGSGGRQVTGGLTLDTGALLALDHPAKALLMQAWLAEARRRGGSICVPAGAVAQAWRDPKQARLARLLKSADVEIVTLTLSVARVIGVLCGRTGHADVVDVHVAVCARERNHAVVTSDPDDLQQVDPLLPLLRV